VCRCKPSRSPPLSHKAVSQALQLRTYLQLHGTIEHLVALSLAEARRLASHPHHPSPAPTATRTQRSETRVTTKSHPRTVSLQIAVTVATCGRLVAVARLAARRHRGPHVAFRLPTDPFWTRRSPLRSPIRERPIRSAHADASAPLRSGAPAAGPAAPRPLGRQEWRTRATRASRPAREHEERPSRTQAAATSGMQQEAGSLRAHRRRRRSAPPAAAPSADHFMFWYCGGWCGGHGCWW